MPAQRDKHAIKPPTHPCALDRCDLRMPPWSGTSCYACPGSRPMLNRSPGYDDLTQGSNALGVPLSGCFMENVYALSVSRFLQRGSKCHHPDDTFRTRTVREPLTHEGSCPDASETCKPSAPTSPSPSTWPWRTKRCSATSPRPPSSSNCWSGIINRPHPLAWPGQRFLPKPGAIKLASVTPVQSGCPAQAGALRSS